MSTTTPKPAEKPAAAPAAAAPAAAPTTATGRPKLTDAERGAAESAEKAALDQLVTLMESHKQIERAVLLEKERDTIMEKVGKNRTYLRLMRDNDELTPEQDAWLAQFYADKERGERRSDDDVETARQARELARKVIYPRKAAS